MAAAAFLLDGSVFLGGDTSKKLYSRTIFVRTYISSWNSLVLDVTNLINFKD